MITSNLLLALQAAAAFGVALAADDTCYAFTTEVFEEDCKPTPSPGPPAPNPTEVLTVIMPECHVCENKCACSATKTYTTTYEAFCPTGVAKQTWTVAEVYPSMSSVPQMAAPTDCPHGFTTTVATCTVCGPEPITKTLTYPHGGPTFVPGDGGKGGNGGNGAQPGDNGAQSGGGDNGTKPGNNDGTKPVTAAAADNSPMVNLVWGVFGLLAFL